MVADCFSLMRPNDHCDGCGASFNAEPRAPVLIDATWAKLAKQHETLCASCLLNRAIARRVLLTVADLVPCEFNRWGSPSLRPILATQVTEAAAARLSKTLENFASPHANATAPSCLAARGEP
jgi:hypothetical protein